LPTGEIINYGCKTLKNVAGYDLISLILGSYGRYGIITKILLRFFSNDNFYYEIEKSDKLRVKNKTFSDSISVELKRNIDPNMILV